MKDWKGTRLYVNLSASQVRKRLKGVGLGIRKVESAGKNRAVIIHTATGDHERDLRRMFAGYLDSDKPEAPESEGPAAPPADNSTEPRHDAP